MTRLKGNLFSVHIISFIYNDNTLGCNSSQRREILLRAFKKIGLKPKRPILRAATRWNSIEMCLQRCLYLLPALKQITNDDMPLSADDQESWSSLLFDVESNSRLIEAFIPVLNTISQWTQALSTNGNVTISLVPLAVKKIMEAIDLMSTHADDFRKESDKVFITGLAESLHEQLSIYFSGSSLECYCYLVSAFLDPRVFETLTENEKTIIKNKLVSENDDEYKGYDQP
jgi:hypothetical protein